jgi:tetratricopeptide (TPR) repeat protein
MRAQEAAGGSIKDFKKPSNPPVYGGKIPKGPKNSSTSKPDTEDPAATKAREDATGSKRLGGFGSLIGAPRSAATTVSRPTPPPAPPTPAPAQPASAFNKDLEDAIAAGNDARSANPPNYDEAEKAYRLAAKIAPTDARPYEGLGNIFIDQRKYQDAFAAYEQAVKLGSENPEVFESLADSYLALGRFEDSRNASSRSITLNPKRPGPYFTRAWVNLYLKNGAAAGDDARAVLERWQPAWAGEQPFYTAVVGYFGYWQAGRKEDANKLLAEAAKACTSAAWVCQPIRYLSREQTAEELIARANDNDKMTEARAYVAIDLVLGGKTAEAQPYLEWVKANGNKTFYEYHLTVAWLEK